jgi:hypothetical protein
LHEIKVNAKHYSSTILFQKKFNGRVFYFICS